MVLIPVLGIASTAAGAIYLYRKVETGDFGEPDAIIRIIRQTTGVVLAVTNFIRAALDALQLLNRPAAAAAAGGAVPGRALIGVRSGDVE